MKLAFINKECWNNKVLNISTIVGIALQILVLTFAPLRNLLKLSICSISDIAIIFLIALIGTVVNAVLSMVRKTN